MALIDRCAWRVEKERERGAIEGDEAFMIVVSVYLTTLGAAQVKMPHFDTLLASNAHK